MHGRPYVTRLTIALHSSPYDTLTFLLQPYGPPCRSMNTSGTFPRQDPHPRMLFSQISPHFIQICIPSSHSHWALPQPPCHISKPLGNLYIFPSFFSGSYHYISFMYFIYHLSPSPQCQLQGHRDFVYFVQCIPKHQWVRLWASHMELNKLITK